jgi:hypothetical protein
MGSENPDLVSREWVTRRARVSGAAELAPEIVAGGDGRGLQAFDELLLYFFLLSVAAGFGTRNHHGGLLHGSRSMSLRNELLSFH